MKDSRKKAEKKSFKPGTMLNPVPVVMVSCGKKPEDYNIITVAWTGVVNSEPPMVYVSVRRSRFSHHIIKEAGEFVINLTTEELARATDYCGCRSGSKVDKFKEMKLTPGKSVKLETPTIEESPINLECRVREIIEYPSHDMFVGEIVNVQVAPEYVDSRGKILYEEAGLISYCHGEYYGLKKKPLGRFGFSVMKAKTKKRLNKISRDRSRNRKKNK